MAQLAAHPCHAYAFELVRPLVGRRRRDGFGIARGRDSARDASCYGGHNMNGQGDQRNGAARSSLFVDKQRIRWVGLGQFRPLARHSASLCPIEDPGSSDLAVSSVNLACQKRRPKGRRFRYVACFSRLTHKVFIQKIHVPPFSPHPGRCSSTPNSSRAAFVRRDADSPQRLGLPKIPTLQRGAGLS